MVSEAVLQRIVSRCLLWRLYAQSHRQVAGSGIGGDLCPLSHGLPLFTLAPEGRISGHDSGNFPGRAVGAIGQGALSLSERALKGDRPGDSTKGGNPRNRRGAESVDAPCEAQMEENMPRGC